MRPSCSGSALVFHAEGIGAAVPVQIDRAARGAAWHARSSRPSQVGVELAAEGPHRAREHRRARVQPCHPVVLIGIGWDSKDQAFSDDGRALVTKQERDRGAFKTPSLRDCTKHPPYMHDGSVATLREVIVFYNQGGHRNPNLDPKIQPLGLSEKGIDALVKMLHSLDGEGYQDTPPSKFPQ